MATIAQIILALLLLYTFAILLKLLMPHQAGDFYANVFGEIPVFGKIISLVYEFFKSDGSAVSTLSTYNALLQALGQSMFDAFIVAFSILCFNHIHRLLSWNGCEVLAAVFGSAFGILILELIKTSPLYYKYIAFGFLILLAFVLALLYTSFEKKGVSGLFISPVRVFWAIFLHFMLSGLQAIIAGYTMFFASCIMVSYDRGLHGFDQILTFLVIPFLIWVAFLVLERIIDWLIDPKKG